MSDIPVSQQTGRAGDAGEGFDAGQTAGEGQTAEEEDQGMLQSAQEMVAKALGVGSRGMLFFFFFFWFRFYPEQLRANIVCTCMRQGLVRGQQKTDIANAGPCM